MKKYCFYLSVNMTTNSEHLSNSSAKAVTPACVYTHTHTYRHEPLGLTSTKKNHATQQEGKVAGNKMFTDSNFGIEVAGKQKGTWSGSEDLVAGAV